jgi:hypothetical protein
VKNKHNIPFRHFGVTDIESIAEPWRGEFDKEVKEGNFVRGGKSLFLLGPGAEKAHEQWAACLALINMPVYFMTPHELLSRVRQRHVLRDTEETKANFEEAETWFVAEFFNGLWEKDDLETFYWTLKEAINDGVVIVIAADDETAVAGLYLHDPILGLCEQHFEAINGKKPKTIRRKKRDE